MCECHTRFFFIIIPSKLSLLVYYYYYYYCFLFLISLSFILFFLSSKVFFSSSFSFAFSKNYKKNILRSVGFYKWLNMTIIRFEKIILWKIKESTDLKIHIVCFSQTNSFYHFFFFIETKTQASNFIQLLTWFFFSPFYSNWLDTTQTM